MVQTGNKNLADNVEYCLNFLKDAVQKIPEANLKDDALKALEYLSIVFVGKAPRELDSPCHEFRFLP